MALVWRPLFRVIQTTKRGGLLMEMTFLIVVLIFVYAIIAQIKSK